MDSPEALSCLVVASFVLVAVAIGLAFRRLTGLSGRPGQSPQPHPWPPEYLPLVLTATPETLILAHPIQEAARFWNRRTRMDLFFPVLLELTEEEAGRSNLVHFSTTMSGLKVVIDPPGKDPGTPVSVPPVANSAMVQRVMARELGQVLGLELDEDPDSVMCASPKCGHEYGVTVEQRSVLFEWYG